MNLIAIRKLLKTNFSVTAHLDTIPEKARLPAISYEHLNHSAARLLSGTKSGRSDRWLLNIVTKKDEDIERLVKEAETLHNIKNDDYKGVFITLGKVGVQVKDEPTRTTTIFIQTYEV